MKFGLEKFSRGLVLCITIYLLFCYFGFLSEIDQVSAQTASNNVQVINAPIQLQAPLPIGEAGEQIENSNKSYLFTYMVKLYRFVLGIAGIAAIIELIIAGFQIALAADDSGGVENGKKRVIQTLEGVSILFCSAIVLNTINPVGFNFDEEVVVLESKIMEIEAAVDNAEYNSRPNSNTTNYSNGSNVSSNNTWVSKSLTSHPHINDIIKLGGNGKIPSDKLQKLSINHVNGSNQYMYKPAAEAFEQFYAYAKSQNKAFTIYQAFRSYADQEWFYACYKSGGATGTAGRPCNGQSNLAAFPGTSMHGWGLAVDLAGYDYAWVRANAARFNFRETVSGEPWHWEWWGPNNNPQTTTPNTSSSGNTGGVNNQGNNTTTTSTGWTDKKANEISYMENPSVSDNNIFIGIAGLGLNLGHTKPWVKALNDAALKGKNVKHVFAVTGPYSIYANTTQDQKLIESLYSQVFSIKSTNSKIIIASHSSGGYVGSMLVSKLIAAKTPKNNIFYVNLDGVGPNVAGISYIQVAGKISYNNNVKNPDITIVAPKGCTSDYCFHLSVISSAANNANANNAYTNANASNVEYKYLNKFNW